MPNPRYWLSKHGEEYYAEGAGHCALLQDAAQFKTRQSKSGTTQPYIPVGYERSLQLTALTSLPDIENCRPLDKIA